MRAHGIALLLIVVVCVGAFAWALPNELLWDDKLIIVDNPGVHDLSHPLKFFALQYWRVVRADYRAMPRRGYRPIPELLFAVDYSLWGLNPVGYHAVSIMVHAANCVLLYVLMLRILRHARGAAFCALLFAAHPIHVEAVVWAKACSELLALLFVLIAVLVYRRYIISPAPSRSPHLHLCTVAVFALALMCKASAATLPALLALYIWCFVPRARWRRGLFGLIPFVGIVGVFFAIKASLPHIPSIPQVDVGSVALTGVAALWVYLKLLLVPAGLCAHHRVYAVLTLFDPAVLRVLLVGLLLLVGAIVAARRSRVAFFALGWAIVGLAPLAVLDLMGRRVGELRAYSPSIGFCLLVALLLSRLPALASTRAVRASLERATIALCAFLVLAYTGLSAVRARDWATEFTLWHDTWTKNPDSWHALAGLSEVYIKRARYEEAIDLLEDLLDLNPTDRPARYRLAASYLETDRQDDAMDMYERLADEDPADARAIAALGGLYGKRGEHRKAMAHFRAALRAMPRSAYAHRQLAIYYINNGRYAEALEELQEALPLKPESPATWLALGACYEGLGNRERAIDAYQRCAKMQASQAGEAKLRLGQFGAEPDTAE